VPTPLGHALVGLTVAWACLPDGATAAGPRHSETGTPPAPGGIPAPTARWFVAACVLSSVAPDLDIVLASHRGPWHSLAGGLLASGLAALAALAWHRRPGRLAWACLAAWETHVLLDWLGKDSSPPRGIMALWPISREYFQASLQIFPEVSRRYWRPSEFVVGNLESLAWELAIVGPPCLLVWLWLRHRRRPVQTSG
jgi:membrane-bound metal-dependent hydrolase YbcI (DUF457 family)